MKRPKIALFDLDGTLADYDGQLLKDLQKIASPHEPLPVLYQNIPYLEARRHVTTSQSEIEIFFKAIKQNLKIKTFVGTSKNALLTQIWTALIAILLLKFLKFKSSLNWSLSNLVAMLRYNLFTYRDLWLWLDNPFEVPALSPNDEQLTLAFR